MDHDRCPKGLAGHKRRLGAWRREVAFRTVLLMVAIGYAAGTPLAFPETKNNGTNQRVNQNVEIIS